MWFIPLLMLLASSVLFVFIKPLSMRLSENFSNISNFNSERVLKTVASLLFLIALAVNISVWKAESAVILTMTLFGPFMFFAIFKKTETK